MLMAELARKCFLYWSVGYSEVAERNEKSGLLA